MRGAPVFIVGCGRSGTTALGEVLGTHPEVTYLNEPRKLWRRDPRTDLTSKEPPGPRALDIYDVDDETRKRIRKAFFNRAGEDDVLIEKTPVNSFRIDYLRALFPNARFVHLLRNGLHVARSIERWIASGRRWHGADGIKWDLMLDYARRHDLGAEAAVAADAARLQGLLEWRLVVTHVRARLSPRDLELRYEELVTDPRGSIVHVLDWIGLDADAVDPDVLRRDVKPTPRPSHEEERVAGDLLRELGYLSAD